jgi:hypothetical protein
MSDETKKPSPEFLKWVTGYDFAAGKDVTKLVNVCIRPNDRITQMMLSAPRGYGRRTFFDAMWPQKFPQDEKRSMILIDDLEDDMADKANTEILKIEIEATRGGYVVDIGCEDFIYPTAEAMVRDLLAYLTADDKREFERAFLLAHPKGKAL